jgi:hypothetical protein
VCSSNVCPACPSNGPTCADIANGVYPPQAACGIAENYWSLYFQCLCATACLDACASNYCAGGAMSSECAVCAQSSPGCDVQMTQCLVH